MSPRKAAGVGLKSTSSWSFASFPALLGVLFRMRQVPFAKAHRTAVEERWALGGFLRSSAEQVSPRSCRGDLQMQREPLPFKK